MLDVVQLEHVAMGLAATASGRASSRTQSLSRSAFLISSALTYGYSAYSRKLGRWCSRTNLMNAGVFVFQSSGNPSRFSKIVLMPYLREQRHRILGVLVEVGVEDALIHEVRVAPDVEEHPAQVMQLEHGEAIGEPGDRVLDLLPVLANGGLSSRA